MANDETTTSTDSTEEGVTEGQEPEAQETPSEATDAPVSDEQEPEAEKPGLTLEDATAALSKVRKSEAAMRTRLREIEAKLSEAKTADEVAALTQQIKDENAAEQHKLLVENVALKHRLPEDLAATLTGATREELEAHASVLAKYVPKEPTVDPDLTGGLQPDQGGDTFDPVAAARKARQRRY